MTTDPFTEAELADYARAEAETRWPQRRAGHYVQQLAFVAGAEWARAHLAAQEGHRRVRKYADDWDTCTCGYDAWPCRSQEPTDAEVEAAARAIAAEQDRRIGLKAGVWWSAERRRNLARTDARAALSAARAARRDETGDRA
ncbi:hypothetical protein [Brachybacterium massiliense]|uniref:hypothetical protein n=1 Tax=Brachybacterium massiliense TaxID=1755098 RepID=UPI000B3BB2DB|nr:hypothetical protein [Brachybacterium massiliense]